MQFRQSLVQTQSLKMNPQLYQSIKLMELPSLDLREKIEEELERNPALEMLEDKITVSLERNILNSKRNREQISKHNDHRQFIEGTLSKPETLQEHLLWQIQLEPIDDDLRRIAETLIQNINEDGFYIEEPSALFKEEHEKPFIEKAVKLVQKLEPVGCCTKDYKESLKVQIELTPHYLPEEIPEEVTEILLDNLDLIEKEKYAVLAKLTGLDTEDISDICELIKTLSPFPGRVFTVADTRFVIPDIKITKTKNDDGEEELVINLNDEAFPVLGVSKFYKKLTNVNHEKNTSEDFKAARNFARENIKEACLFIDHLKRRNQTLIRVANAILQFQREFFLKGPKYLAPLTLKDIAKELEVHETTVSRIANGKYMQTEWGIFEIRYFFTNSVGGLGTENAKFSKEGVKEVIKEILTAEKKGSGSGRENLSDQEISAILSKKGIALARRTVAKYRKELDINSSYTRRSHDRQ